MTAALSNGNLSVNYAFAESITYRFFSNYFESGLGFQLRYEATNVSQWSYGSGACGGNFITRNGILTSPSYPENYPDKEHCIYTISQPPGTIILLKFLSMDLQYSSYYCSSYDDNLEIRDGPAEASPLLYQLCGYEIPAPIKSSQNQIWIK